ncbi:MAG: hypothetical protein ACRD1E_12940, partial [Terriglobales bacterium]
LKVIRLGPRGWTPLIALRPQLIAAFHLSVLEAVAAFLTRYLDLAVCATEAECAAALAPVATRAQVHAALVGLEAARHVSLDAIEGQPALRLRASGLAPAGLQ